MPSSRQPFASRTTRSCSGASTMASGICPTTWSGAAGSSRTPVGRRAWASSAPVAGGVAAGCGEEQAATRAKAAMPRRPIMGSGVRRRNDRSSRQSVNSAGATFGRPSPSNRSSAIPLDFAIRPAPARRFHIPEVDRMLRPRTAAVVSLLLIPMVAGGFLLQQAPPQATPRLFDQVLSIVANRYVDSLQGNQMFEKAARGLVHELNDPYSELLAPKENEEFNRSV